jgi:hypothetical protein
MTSATGSTSSSATNPIVATGPAVGILPVKGHKPITVIGNNSIRAGFDAKCRQQAINSRRAEMALGANFATANHLLISALVLEAFQEVLPGCQGNLVYFISHNIARKGDGGQRARMGAP